ncbi:MAG: FG-GAP repeat protein, partial [Phycisphaerales bacterium]|jgi:hypothetical protein
LFCGGLSGGLRSALKAAYRRGLFGVFGALLALVLASPALAQRSTPLQLVQPGGAANDQFGQSVAIDGDTMIVGANLDDIGANTDQGSASVYRWTGSGWTFEATLTASDGLAGDQFGVSVAISGDTAIVCASFDDVGANIDQGSAYVFVRIGTTWTQQAKLTAADGAANDRFGRSVAISGDTVIVGAWLDDVGANADQGSAYVFARSGTTWTQQAKLTAADGAAADEFGISVAVSGNTAIVGAFLDDVGPNADQGSAYVFIRTGAAWTQQAKLTAADGAAADQFGLSVALSGDTAIVGASADDVGANANQGSAYIFVRAGTAWSQQAQLIAADGAANDQLGSSIALSGDTAIVGAQNDTIGSNASQGSAYVFVRSGTAWTQQAKLTAIDGAFADVFGNSVAISGDMAVVGAVVDDIGANTNQGSAWVFSRIGSKWIGPDLTLTASDGAASDSFGISVAISGDTAIVGANGDDIGANLDQGSAYVFVRNGTTWTQQAKLTASDGAANDLFGTSVAISGDTAIVGAAQDTIGTNSAQGSAYVFVRSGTTWTQQAKFTASDGAANDFFGISVAISGSTAIVGSYIDDVGSNLNQGSAYVFVRSGTTWTQQMKLTATDGAADDVFGYAVALSGDIAIIGAPGDDIGANTDQGSAYIFVRVGTNWTQQSKLIAIDSAAFDYFGNAVSISGDTALVGVPYDTVSATLNQGSAYVFVRSGTTWAQQAKLTASDGAQSDFFGGSVAISGSSVIVGAFGDDVGAIADQGSAYLFVRNGTTWTQQTKLTAIDGATSDYFGGVVAISGGTAIIGVYGDDVGANANQGSARLFDVPVEDLALAHNDVTDSSYPTLAAALLPAQSGQQITATEAAWRGVGSVNSLGRSLGLFSSSNLRTSSTSVLDLSGSSSLASGADASIEIYGQLRAAGFVNVDSDTFRLGSRGILTARTGSSLSINASTAQLDGQTRLEQGASLTFAGSATAIGSTTANLNSAITTGATFTNMDTFTITAGTMNTPLFFNRAQANTFGASAVFGSFTNDFGATTTIRSGTLFVFGSLTNNGTIIGTICSNCAGSPPNMDVGGNFAIGPASSLTFPFVDSLIHMGGDFDCAINSNTRFDLSLATLQLEGSGLEQTLEVMSTDIGPSPAGLDRAQPGNYPIGTLHIGPASSTVRLVDAHDNDGLGQASCEALYVDHLQIDAGSHLINPSCRIYYTTASVLGTVDVPANLIQLGGPPCDPDVNQDGNADQGDVDYLVNVVAGGPNPSGIDPDFNQDGNADQGDIDALINVVAGGACP